MAKSEVSKADLDALKEAGYVEGDINTIPDNISPVLKSQLIEQWREENNAGPDDFPDGVEKGNELARARAAADGDEVMQQRYKDDKVDPLDHDGDGKKGGTKATRQNKAASDGK